jgi:hypothetical protein
MVYEPERNDMKLDCRRLHGGELHDLNCRPNVLERSESRSLEQGKEMCIQSWWGNLREGAIWKNWA